NMELESWVSGLHLLDQRMSLREVIQGIDEDQINRIDVEFVEHVQDTKSGQTKSCGLEKVWKRNHSPLQNLLRGQLGQRLVEMLQLEVCDDDIAHWRQE
ncbi:hypothetical protein WICPIJ_004858, partial [Wickerhamomyces pijperi]